MLRLVLNHLEAGRVGAVHEVVVLDWEVEPSRPVEQDAPTSTITQAPNRRRIWSSRPKMARG